MKKNWMPIDAWAGTKGYPVGEYAYGCTWKGRKLFLE